MGTGVSFISGMGFGFHVTSVSLPLVLSGTGRLRAQSQPVSLEIVTADGVRYDVPPVRNANPGTKDPVTTMLLPAGPDRYLRQTLNFYNDGLWNRIRSGRVTLRGRMIVEYSQPGEGVELREGDVRYSRSPARCQVSRISGMPSGFPSNVLECDSVKLGGRDIHLGRREGALIRGSSPLEEHLFWSFSRFPGEAWLSPVHRSLRIPGGPDGTLVVTPQLPRGFEVVDYTIPNLDLNQFVLRRAR
jgi:hypothetical protein